MREWDGDWGVLFSSDKMILRHSSYYLQGLDAYFGLSTGHLMQMPRQNQEVAVYLRSSRMRGGFPTIPSPETGFRVPGAEVCWFTEGGSTGR